MKTKRIRALVDEFLSLIRTGSGERARDEAALPRLLDELALARHHLHVEFDATEQPDPPDWPYEERRALASERFPDHGYYNVVGAVCEPIAETEVVVGDAIDDLADIAGDLAQVAWAWRHTSEADALRRFAHSCDRHWGTHLRDLQKYLHARRHGG